MRIGLDGDFSGGAHALHRGAGVDRLPPFRPETGDPFDLRVTIWAHGPVAVTLGENTVWNVF
jgi:hypothetical protein